MSKRSLQFLMVVCCVPVASAQGIFGNITSGLQADVDQAKIALSQCFTSCADTLRAYDIALQEIKDRNLQMAIDVNAAPADSISDTRKSRLVLSLIDQGRINMCVNRATAAADLDVCVQHCEFAVKTHSDVLGLEGDYRSSVQHPFYYLAGWSALRPMYNALVDRLYELQIFYGQFEGTIYTSEVDVTSLDSKCRAYLGLDAPDMEQNSPLELLGLE